MRSSRRIKRMSRNRVKITKMNLTSLMDVFTILVFFLLVNSGSVELVEAPKDVKDSVTQAGAAAARAGALLNAGKVTVEAITCSIDTDRCNACGLCVGVCPYGALSADKATGKKAAVVEARASRVPSITRIG